MPTSIARNPPMTAQLALSGADCRDSAAFSPRTAGSGWRSARSPGRYRDSETGAIFLRQGRPCRTSP